MALERGACLGSYEIVELLGAGGMGEVYRARDLTLKREVAIKILRDAVAHEPDGLARFEREAQLLASVNHPNIAHIHGLEELSLSTSAGAAIRALVMELVEGPTLAERLDSPSARGAGLALDEARAIAEQVAAALEAAHGQGIVHR